MHETTRPHLPIKLDQTTGVRALPGRWSRDLDELLTAILPGTPWQITPGSVPEYREAIDALIALTLSYRRVHPEKAPV